MHTNTTSSPAPSRRVRREIARRNRRRPAIAAASLALGVLAVGAVTGTTAVSQASASSTPALAAYALASHTTATPAPTGSATSFDLDDISDEAEEALVAAADALASADDVEGDVADSGLDLGDAATDVDTDALEEAIEDLDGAHLLPSPAVADMTEDVTTLIAAVSEDVAGMRGSMGPHVYSALKAAVIGLTQSVAVELAKDSIRVNAICPGGIMTPIFLGDRRPKSGSNESLEEALRPVFTNIQPIPRAGEPKDIANAALFLASDESSFITGHALVVDGGLTTGRRRDTPASDSPLRHAINSIADADEQP